MDKIQVGGVAVGLRRQSAMRTTLCCSVVSASALALGAVMWLGPLVGGCSPGEVAGVGAGGDGASAIRGAGVGSDEGSAINDAESATGDGLPVEGCGVGMGAGGGGETHGPRTPPHVVVVLADDLGYGSTNSYGARRDLVSTPQMERLATEGVRFTQANEPSSVCSPTRYGLLYGRYLWRTLRRTGVVQRLEKPWPSRDRVSLAFGLKSRGYVTATIGKWHLGYGENVHCAHPKCWVDDLEPGPRAAGFDYSFHVPQNHGDVHGVYFANATIVGFNDQDQKVELQSRRQIDYGETTYGSKFIGYDVPQRKDQEVASRLTDRAVQWMKSSVLANDSSLFIYFAPIAVHQPIIPSVGSRGTSRAGTYRDFIHDLDNSVGGILNALDELGIADNTLVVFTSNNGGFFASQSSERESPEATAFEAGLWANGNLGGGKTTIWEGGTRVPLLVRMPKRTDTKAHRQPCYQARGKVIFFA